MISPSFQAGHWFQCQLCHTLQETHRLFIHAKDAHEITDLGQATALCISPPLMAAAAADAMSSMQGERGPQRSECGHGKKTSHGLRGHLDSRNQEHALLPSPCMPGE